MLRERMGRESGQATVEYGLVLFAFLASIVALGALWHWTAGGELLAGAVRAASHSWGEGEALDMSSSALLLAIMELIIFKLPTL